MADSKKSKKLVRRKSSGVKKKDKEKTSFAEKEENEAIEVTSNDVLKEVPGYYFEAYSCVQSHEGMIKDHVRTSAYKRAMELNRHLFEDKIVLDVGCGLGILSLFAASAGAKTVIGIDASDIALYAQKVVEKSGFRNIFIVKSKVEEVEKLPHNIEEVDIIVSEWMGVCLYHESMLSTVLFARDKWLKKDGLLFPDQVNFYLAGINDMKRQLNGFHKWNVVCGFSLAPMLDILFSEPVQECINSNQVVTSHENLRTIDLNTASSDYSFTAEFNLTVNQSCFIGGFVSYFEAIFSKCHKPVVLSTSPFSPPTHWRQSAFYLRDPIPAYANDEIVGKFILNPFQHNFRDLEIQICGKHKGQMSGRNFNTRYILR